jgi:hypothetical protein
MILTLASIIGSAIPDEAAYRAKRLNYPNNNAFDKSGVYSKLLEVADAVIKALTLLTFLVDSAQILD